MKPLAGMRVIAVEQYGAAPYGTMLLAALGADVIKVEQAATGGDQKVTISQQKKRSLRTI